MIDAPPGGAPGTARRWVLRTLVVALLALIPLQERWREPTEPFPALILPGFHRIDHGAVIALQRIEVVAVDADGLRARLTEAQVMEGFPSTPEFAFRYFFGQRYVDRADPEQMDYLRYNASQHHPDTVRLEIEFSTIEVVAATGEVVSVTPQRQEVYDLTAGGTRG